MAINQPMRFLCSALITLAAISCFVMPSSAAEPKLYLHSGWQLQSSCVDKTPAETISSKGFQPKGWISTTVPSTVVAAQVSAGIYKDIFVGTNLRKLPGVSYKIGDIFNLREMPPDSPYVCSWWYRTNFKLPAAKTKGKVALHFQGINYRANVWMNGKKIADSADIAGGYRRHELDITPFVSSDGNNVLAVETFAPTTNDLGVNFVDWNPTPPDKDMGIWGDVFLTTSGPVTVRYPQAVTQFQDKSLAEADLTLMAEVSNHSDKAVEGTLEAVFDGAAIKQPVKLDAGEERSVSFTPDQFPTLKIKNPKLWWPVHMGAQNLHPLTVRFLVNGQVSDEQSARVGIREMTSELTDKGARLYRVNGKPILVRGGGWSQDMLLRHSKERTEQQLRYTLAMNLNTIRMEAQLDHDDFFDFADEHGILVMAGWCCCDIWERWKEWTPATLKVATASLRSQILRLRSHPSLLVWLNGSDGPPPADVERAYLQVEKEAAWPNPTLSSAAAVPTEPTGPSGVKMTGPYDYEPPDYWLMDKDKWGGAWGFNTETSPGPAIPVKESLQKFLPADHLWPIDDVWNFHAGGERFMTVDRYNEGMNKIYGPPTGLDDYLVKAQAMNYDGQRAMFEAYAKNKYASTGVIQWMINNAWPSLIWHLWDYYLQPGGGYFGTKKACEPLHVQYSYDDRSVVVVNGLQEAFKGLNVAADVYDINLKSLYSQKQTVDVDVDGNANAMTIPPFPSDSPGNVFFLKLSLKNAAGKEVSSNFYWLPLKQSELDWEKTPDSAFTPVGTFEDMTGLNQLPKVKVNVASQLAKGAGSDIVRVKVHNPTRSLAFQVHLAVTDSKGQEILPVMWDDNYLTLMPGESRDLAVHYMGTNAPARDALIKVDGWNIEPVSLRLGVPSAPAKKETK